MNPALCLPAPAKLNLMLHITGRRADGYHLLQTVFQFLDFADQIRLTLREDDRIQRCNQVTDLPAEQDIVVKAARLLQKSTGSRRGADIEVHKQIPMGAGLGGGSSDAATTLLGLNRLWQCGLEQDELAELGLQLGADVPVFIRGFAAFAEGIGEQLSEIKLPQPWYLVITPQVHVSTAEIFASSRLTRDCPALKICDLFQAGTASGALRYTDNVFTPVVTGSYPEVETALTLLDSVGTARMSGTGASVFAEFGSRQAAEQALSQLRESGLPENWNSVVSQGKNRSPLYDALN